MPFAPDQRKAVEYAQTVVAETGSFRGMLPSGTYIVGGIQFEAEPNEAFQEIVVSKQKGGGKEKGEGGGKDSNFSRESFLNYHGPVASVGGGYLLSGQPGVAYVNGAPGEGDSAIDFPTAYAPASISAAGMNVQLGYELGITYRAPEMGAVVALEYAPSIGTHQIHMMRAMLGYVIRPGQLRIVAGPTYNFGVGTGIGVADWFDIGQDRTQSPTDLIDYRGTTFGPGAELAVGYGVLDLEPFRGLIELNGNWQADDQRSYWGFGLRVGIVPAVPRFEG